MEIIAQGITVRFKDFWNAVSLAVKSEGFWSVRGVRSVIFKRDTVAQFVGGQKLPIPVADVAAGCFEGSFLCRHETEIVPVGGSVDDLQVVEPVDQYAGHEYKYNSQNGRTADAYPADKFL